MNIDEEFRQKEKSLKSLRETLCHCCGEIIYWEGDTYDLRYTNHKCDPADEARITQRRRKEKLNQILKNEK